MPHEDRVGTRAISTVREGDLVSQPLVAGTPLAPAAEN